MSKAILITTDPNGDVFAYELHEPTVNISQESMNFDDGLRYPEGKIEWRIGCSGYTKIYNKNIINSKQKEIHDLKEMNNKISALREQASGKTYPPIDRRYPYRGEDGGGNFEWIHHYYCSVCGERINNHQVACVKCRAFFDWSKLTKETGTEDDYFNAR